MALFMGFSDCHLSRTRGTLSQYRPKNTAESLSELASIFVLSCLSMAVGQRLSITVTGCLQLDLTTALHHLLRTHTNRL
jgi:hypothetical protein